MPSVLIETGFLTNADEEKFLADPESQKKMAQSIFKAFTEYKKYYDAADLGAAGNTAENGSEMDPAKFGLPETDVKADELIYRVQIETSTTKIAIDDARFKGMPTFMYEDKGLFKYTVGAFRDTESANALKTEMRTAGYQHAFVVVMKGNVRVNL
jgi:N-acetylmuramoyl-L-alanine amidase